MKKIFCFTIILLVFFNAFPTGNVVYKIDKTQSIATASFKATIASIGSANKSWVMGENNSISGKVTCPLNIDINNIVNKAKFVGTTGSAVDSVIIYCMSGMPRHQIFDSSVSAKFYKGAVVCVLPIWFGNDLYRAIMSLPDSGGSVYLDAISYGPVTQRITKSNVKIIGSKRPYYKSDYSKLESGSIINGPFKVEADNFELHNVGIDAGSSVCTAYYSGVAQDAFDFSNLGQDTTKAPKKNIIINNCIFLCKDAQALTHACLVENVTNSNIDKIETRYGTHGFVIKGQFVTASNIKASAHRTDGLIIKNNTYAKCNNVNVSNLEISGLDSLTGGVIIDNTVGPTHLFNITINGYVADSVSFGINISGNSDTTKKIKGVSLIGEKFYRTSSSLWSQLSGSYEGSSLMLGTSKYYGDNKDYNGINGIFTVGTDLYLNRHIYYLNKNGITYDRFLTRDTTGGTHYDGGFGDLDLSGTIYYRGSMNLLNKNSNGWLNFATRNTSGSDAVFDLTNVGKLVPDSIYCRSLLLKNTNTMPLLLGRDTTNAVLWRIGSTEASWSAGGGKFIISRSTTSRDAYFAIDSNGNVGIDTVSPTAKLYVHGTIKSDDTIYAIGQQIGAGGSVLKEAKIIDGAADTLSITVGAKTWKFLPVANQ